MTDREHSRWMARALQLARHGLYTTRPNPRVGCVIVRNGKAAGEGWHMQAGEPHAEVLALRAAGNAARGATVYLTLEPCAHHGRTPPCADALVDAGVARVVVAMRDPDPRVAGAGLARLREAGIEVIEGVANEAAAQLNPGFLSRVQHGRPWVCLKAAMSLDGRTAMASGESRWVTGPEAREEVHHLRARSAAVMTGSGTVLADDPSLNVRLDGGVPHPGGSALPWPRPLRVVLDSQLRMAPASRMLALEGQTLVLAARDHASRRQALEQAGAEVAVVGGDAQVDLAAALALLGEREINEVLVEAGPRLGGALLAAGLVDELVIYMAPHLMGDAARGLFTLPGLERMAQRLPVEMIDIQRVGEDWRITARPKFEKLNMKSMKGTKNMK